MFFLISYGLLNYATYFEARSFSPSFRPRFRFFDYRFSLLGGLSCLGVMLAIDLRTGIVAVAIPGRGHQSGYWPDEPEEGKLGEIAAVQDALAAAQKQLENAEKEADRAVSSEPEKKEQALAAAVDSEADAESLENAKTEVDKAKKEVEQLLRKAAKAKAKVEQAEKNLSALGISLQKVPED